MVNVDGERTDESFLATSVTTYQCVNLLHVAKTKVRDGCDKLGTYRVATVLNLLALPLKVLKDIGTNILCLHS